MGLCCVCAQSLQLCLTVRDPMDCSPPGSSVRGILQARVLEWVAMPSSRGSSPPGGGTRVSYISCTGKWVLYCWTPGKAPICLWWSQNCLFIFCIFYQKFHKGRRTAFSVLGFSSSSKDTCLVQSAPVFTEQMTYLFRNKLLVLWLYWRINDFFPYFSSHFKYCF